MYDALPSFILGFHGGDRSIAESVFEGNARLKPSENAYDWLGHGVYFWENNPQRALEYARELAASRRRRRTAMKEPAVVGAVIDLGRCLNLLDHDLISMVKDAYQSLASIMQEIGKPPPENRGGKDLRQQFLDCAVLQHLHQTRVRQALPPFDTVRGVFLEGEPIYPTAGFHEKSHTQVCVRNPRCIKGYFRVLPDPDADAA